VSFRAAGERTEAQVRRGLTALLSDQVACLDARVADPSFHALSDARGKHYRYVLRPGGQRSPLRRDRTWTTGFALDPGAVRTALPALLGTHDFTSFRATGCTAPSPIRTVTAARLSVHGDEWHVDLHGRGFLRHMVRNVVGSLVDVGRGYREPGWLTQVIAARNRTLAGRTAPPQGLFLVAVDYGEGLPDLGAPEEG
jgi:tRNA pseudouridine38-40 synthase